MVNTFIVSIRFDVTYRHSLRFETYNFESTNIIHTHLFMHLHFAKLPKWLMISGIDVQMNTHRRHFGWFCRSDGSTHRSEMFFKKPMFHYDLPLIGGRTLLGDMLVGLITCWVTWSSWLTLISLKWTLGDEAWTGFALLSVWWKNNEVICQLHNTDYLHKLSLIQILAI